MYLFRVGILPLNAVFLQYNGHDIALTTCDELRR
ncbi:hypothetical protein NSND_60980 [Nitrospira sp. ND1]|nr:hypothetical protein NSND_60980 [Nitrospira sp. ND1]